jgi:hypothetical protein
MTRNSIASFDTQMVQQFVGVIEKNGKTRWPILNDDFTLSDFIENISKSLDDKSSARVSYYFVI